MFITNSYSHMYSLCYNCTQKQGLSRNTVLMNIGSTVFTSGQDQVGLSRVTRLGGIYLINDDFGSIQEVEGTGKEKKSKNTNHPIF